MKKDKAELARRPLWCVRSEKECTSLRAQFATPVEAIDRATEMAARGSTEWDGFRRMVVVERLGQLKMGPGYRWNRSRTVLLAFGWTRTVRRRGRKILRVEVDPVHADTMNAREIVGSTW